MIGMEEVFVRTACSEIVLTLRIANLRLLRNRFVAFTYLEFGQTTEQQAGF